MNPSHAKAWASLSWPNRISILRLLLVAPFIVLLMNQRAPDWPGARYGALAIFILMAVSDLIDGLLARRLHAKTRLGAILDPLADKVLVICSAVLLSIPRSAIPGAQLSNWVVVAIVGKDLWVIIGCVVVYLVTDRLRVQPTFSGKTCTFGQLIMVGLTLIAPDLNRLVGSLGSGLAAAVSWIIAGMCVWAVISYTRLGLSFIAAEQKPLENAGGHKTENPTDASH